ncbi:hypothetical protein [Stenotrophomonas maltophilia]|uniref:hypothetical protein n=1 Tax=Stenotrophomonas maltophilia TaxID=40324 RepID=UPI0039C01893
MQQRTYIELVLELFAFISLCMAMATSGTPVLVFGLTTILLTVWIPFQRREVHRFTRAVSIALVIAAVARIVIHFLPNPSI